MKNNPSAGSPDHEAIADRARTALHQGDFTLAERLLASGEVDLAELTENLRIYQAELEIQNQELQEAQQESARALSRFATLFQQSPLPLLEVDHMGLIISANDEARRLFVLENINSRNHFLRRLVVEQDLLKVLQGLDDASQFGTAVIHELIFKPVQGGDCRGDLHLARLPAEVGEQTLFVCTVVDLTERLQQKSQLLEAQARLEASDARTRSILRTAPVGIAVMNAERSFIEVNPSMTEITGYTAPELIGKSSRFLYPGEEEFAHVALEKDRQFKQWGRCAIETRMLHKDGGLRDVALSIVPLSTDDPLGHSTIALQDISARKAAEAEIRLRGAALEATANAIMITSADGLIEWANPAFFAMTGHNEAETLGRNPRDLLKSGRQDRATYEDLWKTINAGNVWQGQLINRRKDSSEYHEFQTITPVPDVNGQITHFIAVKQDVTQRVMAELELSAHREHLEDLVTERTVDLQAARQNAERLSKVKSEFLSNMSHEIRTPLNAVLGLAQAGMRSNAGRKCGETFSRIMESGELLLSIINDVLDFSKIEAGKLNLESRPISLDRLIGRAVDLTAERARTKGIRFCVKKDRDLPTACMGDEVRILQILINLLSNAIKFTEQGSVTLNISRLGEQLVFRITDTGIGMSEEQVSHLFSAFEQADSSTTRRFGGTGLGLVISQRLLDLMNGSIRIDSEPGRGSIFEVRLGYTAAVAPTPALAFAEPSGRRLSGLHILAAEDNEINRMVLEELLIDEGVELTCVENGQQALEMIARTGADSWDVVLMDIMMPVMDGHEASRLLQETAPGLPVIGLTAHALEDEREKCIASGMVEHVAKPFSLDQLVEVIRRHTRHSAPKN
ncbi:MAG: PAS domain S-box protein [Azonexus sp.]|nr:PAS domain S-box protein [Azonexus sp.]